LISAEPRAIDRGIPLPTVTEPTQSGLGLAPVRAAAVKKNPANGGAQVLGRTNSEGRRARSANSNAQPRAGFRGFQKIFRRQPSPVGSARNRARPAVVSRRHERVYARRSGVCCASDHLT
jgi:hypothetical protein